MKADNGVRLSSVGLLLLLFFIYSFCNKTTYTCEKSGIYYASYVLIYIIIVPIIFHAFRDKPLFHLQYLIFVLLGVIIGILLIESYEKLHRLNRRLRDMYKLVEASETKYRLIAENTSDLIMLLDKEQAISYLSPSHEHVLGYPSSELLEHKCFKLLLHPEDTPSFRESISRMFEDKESKSMEFRLKHKDGRWIEFESRCMPVIGKEDSVENIVTISRDISERKNPKKFFYSQRSCRL